MIDNPALNTDKTIDAEVALPQPEQPVRQAPTKRLWKVEEIVKLFAACKDKGVRSFKGDGIEFYFERQAKNDGGNF